MYLTAAMIETMVREAMDAIKNAYVPYGNFGVGACVLASDGTFYKGCTIENTTPRLSASAEEVALYQAVADGKREFDGIAVIADTEKPFIPNGGVCQILAEFNVPEVVMANMTGDVLHLELKDLLPYGIKIRDNGIHDDEMQEE